MTMRRIMAIFVGIALACFALAGAGRWLLHWPQPPVTAWLAIGGGYLFAALVLRLLPRWWQEHCDEMYAQPAGRRYARVLWPFLIGYSLTLAASLWLLRTGIASVPLRALIAITPALPIAFMLLAALRYLREIDELQRRIETEAIGIASLLVSVVYFAGGLLDKAKVLHFDAAAVMIWVFPLLMLCYGVAKYFVTKRYL